MIKYIFSLFFILPLTATAQTPPAPQEMNPVPTASPAGVGMTTRATTPSDEVLPTTTTQEATSPSRGVKFTDNPEEATDVYTGGGALPGETYYTRYRNTDGSEGDPFYFVPNFQPVVPYVVSTPNGEFETNTINPHKIAWQIEQGLRGYPDVDYVGYYRVPDIGSESWWSKLLKAPYNIFNKNSNNKQNIDPILLNEYLPTSFNPKNNLEESGALIKHIKTNSQDNI